MAQADSLEASATFIARALRNQTELVCRVVTSAGTASRRGGVSTDHA